MKITVEELDVCPLCDKKISSADDLVSVQSDGELLFYAHKDCFEIVDSFMTRFRESIECLGG